MRRLSATLLLAAALAAPVAAQNSHCAALPASARVEVRGPDNVIPAQLTPRGFTCPRGFTTETVGPVTRCRQPGPARVEMRDPRRDCYAALPLGPVRGLSTLNRPTAACSGQPTIAQVVALRGRNAGWADIALTAPRESGITVEHLRATGGRTPPADDPQVQDCFAHDCRLVRLTLRATTPARVELSLAAPDGAVATPITLNSEAACPAR